jgi:hypothetical protein
MWAYFMNDDAPKRALSSFPAIFYLAAPKRPPVGPRVGILFVVASPTPLWLAWRAAFTIHAAFQCREGDCLRFGTGVARLIVGT